MSKFQYIMSCKNRNRILLPNDNEKMKLRVAKLQYISLLVFPAINYIYCSAFLHRALFSCNTLLECIYIYIYIYIYYVFVKTILHNVCIFHQFNRPMFWKPPSSLTPKFLDADPSVSWCLSCNTQRQCWQQYHKMVLFWSIHILLHYLTSLATWFLYMQLLKVYDEKRI